MTEDRNHTNINPELCKGCGVCVATCPTKCLAIGDDINKMGYKYAKFSQNGCIACGMCFYSCPEFGTISVYKADSKPKKAPKEESK